MRICNFVGGAGPNVTALISSFTTTNNYRPVNVGQIKNTVKPVLRSPVCAGADELLSAGAGRPIPWSNSPIPRGTSPWPTSARRNSLSFDTAVDSDGDGIPDIWEVNIGSIPISAMPWP